MKFSLYASLLLVLCLNVSAAENRFIQTSIEEKDCTVTSQEQDDEGDSFSMDCKGVGAYGVSIGGSDLRYPLYLIHNQEEIQLTSFISFHNTASARIEWLLVDNEPKALIHRISAVGPDGLNDVSYLIVSKLNGAQSCAVEKVAPVAGQNQNVRAREIALNAHNMACQDIGNN